MTNHATQILQQAITEMGDRAKTYDNEAGERSMEATVTAFEAVTDHSLTVEQGWLFMALLKAVRSQQGEYREDSYVDGAAYFGLAGEAACKARNDGQHYDEHPLAQYISHAPEWADQLLQPAGTASIYARNDEGRDKMLPVTADQLHDTEQIFYIM